MEIVVIAMIVWGVVTLIGHASWVIIAAAFRFSGLTNGHLAEGQLARGGKEYRPNQSKPLQMASGGDGAAELVTFCHVLERLVQIGSLTAAEGERLSGLARLQSKRLADLASIAKDPRTPQTSPPPHTGADSSRRDFASSFLAEGESNGGISPNSSGANGLNSDSQRRRDQEPVVLAKLSDSDPQTESESSERPLGSDGRSLSVAELITSFMAQRNIRWGELIAGLLIVTCSIGLVVSLWNTLTEAHRVVPSVIFLTAVASIFSAGLYTYHRWRIRATSRVVLIIAGLLVPLSVLAGLAATGRGGLQVSLLDPAAIVAVLAGSTIYGWLLLRSGHALVGRPLSWAYMVAVMGPTLLLPAIPGLVDVFETRAGWFVGLASSAVMGAWMLEPWRRAPDSGRTCSARSIRMRWTMIGAGTFAMACVVAYAAFAISNHGEVGRDFRSYLPIALSVIPVAVALTTVSRRYAGQARAPLQRFVGESVAILASLAPAAMLAAVLDEPRWLWIWSLSILLSGSIAALLTRPAVVRGWFLLPSTVAALMTSTVWLG
ncbi:MAG: hypothetical protein AAF989_05610, partial [Planctomycetota bacterium]